MRRVLPIARLMAALGLVLLLAMQSVAGAFALGTAAGTPQLDAFGNPLCLSGEDDGGSNGSGIPDHSKLPNCCTFACGMFWPGVAAPTNAASLVLHPCLEIDVVFVNRKAIQRPEADYEPGNPRAPPLTV